MWFFIQWFSFKHHRLGAKAFKCVTEQQQRGVGVGAAPLICRRQPSCLNFQPKVSRRMTMHRVLPMTSSVAKSITITGKPVLHFWSRNAVYAWSMRKGSSCKLRPVRIISSRFWPDVGPSSSQLIFTSCTISISCNYKAQASAACQASPACMLATSR